MAFATNRTSGPVAPAAPSRPDVTDEEPRLSGNLGVLETFFSIMSYNAPLVVVMGVIPVMLIVGNGIGTPMIFVISGLVLAVFASGYIRMSHALPRPGGFYSLISAGLGREVGLGAGLISLLLVYYLLAASYIAFGGVVLGGFVSDTLHGPDLPWYLWAVVFWVVAGTLGYLRIDLSAKVTTVLLLLEIAVVAIYDASVVFGGGGPDGFTSAAFSPDHLFDGSFAIGFMFAMSMFGGFEVAVLLRDEVRDPERTIPLATYGVLAVAGVLFTTTTWLFIGSVGAGRAVAIATDDPAGSMSASMTEFAGVFLVDIASILIITSAFAVALCAHNFSTRYAFNMSVDGIFPKALSRVHDRHESPHVASLAVTIACAALLVPVVLSGVDIYVFYAAALGIVALGMLAIFLLCNFAVMRYLHSVHDEIGIMRAYVLPSIAMVGLGASVVLGVRDFPLLTGGSELMSNILLLLFAATFAAGLAMAIILRRTSPEIYQRIGRQ